MLRANWGIRYVYDSHELEMHRKASYSWAIRRRRRYLERKLIRRADAVITVSESIAEHLKADYRIARPLLVANAPLLDGPTLLPTDVRQDVDLTADVPLAVYVGKLTLNRGVEQTVAALTYDSELHLATVGPRRKATEENVVALAERLGVRERLHFVDSVPPADIVGYIRTADVSVLPIQNACLSYDYCMPSKLLESVFAGIPVAVANLREMRRFVRRYQCGLVMDETDPAHIARTLRQLVEQRGLFTLTPAAREEMASIYGWPSQAEKLGELYERLCLDSRFQTKKLAPFSGPRTHSHPWALVRSES